MRRTISALFAVAAMIALVALPATGATQVVTAAVGSSVSISTPPSAAVNFGTLAIGANTVAGGTLAVTSNTAYTVTVAADKASMTEWDGDAYGSGALTTPLVLTPTLASGVPVVTPLAAVGTTPQTIMVGTGLTSDSATLQLAQTLLASDAPGTYRTVLTYTAAPAL